MKGEKYIIAVILWIVSPDRKEKMYPGVDLIKTEGGGA